MFDYLQEFLAVAKFKSFSEAAESLYMTQSSVSRHISALERYFDAPLFKRTSRSVELTPFGMLLVPRAESILNELLTFQEQVSSERLLQGGKKRLLTIAVLPSFSSAKITHIDYLFNKSFPDIDLAFSEFEACDIEASLNSHKCDFAIMRTFESPFFAKVSLNTDYLVLYKEEYAIVLPKTHPLAQRGIIDLSELKDEVFIMPNDKMLLKKPLISICRSAGFTPNIKYEFHRRENCLNMVSQGWGISFAPKTVLDRFQFDDLTTLSISPSITTSLCLAKSTSLEMTPDRQSFWDFMKGSSIWK